MKRLVRLLLGAIGPRPASCSGCGAEFGVTGHLCRLCHVGARP